MGAAKVRTTEIDLSTTVPSIPGVYGGIVVKATRGSISAPQLMTSDTQYLNTYTNAGSVQVGDDTAHFSALAFLGKSNKLWTMRAENGALFGGALVQTKDATDHNHPLLSDGGILNPLTFAFNSDIETRGVAEITKFTAIADSNHSLAGEYFTFQYIDNLAVGQDRYVWYQVHVPAVAEVQTITCVADSANSLAGKYWLLNDIPADSRNYYIWYKVSGNGADPAVGGRTGVQVTINTNDSAAAVATATATAIAAIQLLGNPVFTTVPSGTTCQVTNVNGGAETAAANGNASGFSFQVNTAGADAFTAGSDPAPGGTGIAVSVNQNDTATAVAAATIIAVQAAGGSNFSCAVVAGQPTKFTITNLRTGATTDATAGTSGFTVQVTTQGVTQALGQFECLLFYGADPGVWNDDVSFDLTNYSTNKVLVGEPGAFLIRVYYKSVQVESFVCSRDPQAKDGFGNNIYVEDALLASAYLRCFDNVAVSSSTLPNDQSTPMSLGGGDDGDAVDDGHLITALDHFSNPDAIQLFVMMDGGNATSAYGQALDTMVSSRGDCVAMLSVPFAAENANDYMTEIVDYRSQTLNLNSSYSALFTPHVLIFDKFNSRDIYVSPDGYAAAAISYSAANFEVWFPPAGLTRGLVNAKDLLHRFDSGELDTLYDNGINPLRFIPGQGISIWGQKTLLTRPSALNRLNVRLLLIAIEPPLSSFLETFEFELNDDITRNKVSLGMDAFMANIKGRRGVTAYNVVCNTTNNTPTVIDNEQLIADVYVKPTRSAEDINLRMIVVSTGTSFEQAAALV